jgi:beta-1,4-mannosyltransferase
VLGDTVRSPRKQFQALALAANQCDVDLVGETGTPLPSTLRHPRIRDHRLAARRIAGRRGLAWLWYGVTNVLASSVALYRLLLRLPRPDVLLVQTPPAIPTLAIAWLAARRRDARLVIDWHNFGWTLLGLRFTRWHPLTLLARVFERWAAAGADRHLCVSKAMAQQLAADYHVDHSIVVHDRPAASFVPGAADPAVRRRIMHAAAVRDDARPALAVSPTSWTRDEDLALLFATADLLESRWQTAGPRDGLVIAVSGRGPGRQAFDARLARRHHECIRIVTTWLEPDEYPGFIASADAGICLHRSSSGVDLPMKLSDMLGAGVPVCALDYGLTLREVIEPGRTALLFRDARELADALDRLFRSWPSATPELERLRAGAAAAASGPRWLDAWNAAARDAVLGPVTAGEATSR